MSTLVGQRLSMRHLARTRRPAGCLLRA